MKLHATIPALVTLVLGCNTSGTWMAQQARAELETYFSRADTTAVLTMSPSDCIACNNSIADWMLWSRGGPERSLVVLFTHDPTERESDLLRAVRIEPHGVLAAPSAASIAGPVIYVAVNGSAIDSALGQEGMLALIDRYRHQGEQIFRSGATVGRGGRTSN